MNNRGIVPAASWGLCLEPAFFIKKTAFSRHFFLTLTDDRLRCAGYSVVLPSPWALCKRSRLLDKCCLMAARAVWASWFWIAE